MERNRELSCWNARRLLEAGRKIFLSLRLLPKYWILLSLCFLGFYRYPSVFLKISLSLCTLYDFPKILNTLTRTIFILLTIQSLFLWVSYKLGISKATCVCWSLSLWFIWSIPCILPNRTSVDQGDRWSCRVRYRTL